MTDNLTVRGARPGQRRAKIAASTLTCLGLGIGALALGYDDAMPSPWRAIFAVSGWVLTGIALALGAAWATYAFRQDVPDALHRWLVQGPIYDRYAAMLPYLNVRQAVEEDIPKLKRLADTFIEGGASPNFVERMTARPETVTIIEDMRRGGRLLGFFILLPLKASTTSRIERGEIRSGSPIAAADLSSHRSKPCSLYVGGIWGPNALGALVVWHMYAAIRAAFEANARLQSVFALPSTKDSRILVKRLSMAPLYRDDEIWRMTRADAMTHAWRGEN